jgi:aryl sulfotransferase
MICALLVFQTPDLPAPLAELSPWVDWLVLPEAELFADLERQRHRRILKTHTPLDGVPTVAGVTYVVVARHPLDVAVSLYHHSANLDRRRIAELSGQAVGRSRAHVPLETWLGEWIDRDVDPTDALELDSLPGVLAHLSDAWRRRDDPGVVLLHYDDLRGDLAGEMRRLAGLLAIDVPEDRWEELVSAASFASMRARADVLAPGPPGVLKSREAFFRQGTSGAGSALLSEAQRARYRARAAELAPPDLLGWLHRD